MNRKLWFVFLMILTVLGTASAQIPITIEGSGGFGFANSAYSRDDTTMHDAFVNVNAGGILLIHPFFIGDSTESGLTGIGIGAGVMYNNDQAFSGYNAEGDARFDMYYSSIQVPVIVSLAYYKEFIVLRADLGFYQSFVTGDYLDYEIDGGGMWGFYEEDSIDLDESVIGNNTGIHLSLIADFAPISYNGFPAILGIGMGMYVDISASNILNIANQELNVWSWGFVFTFPIFLVL